jgi:hypothetical protein
MAATGGPHHQAATGGPTEEHHDGFRKESDTPLENKNKNYTAVRRNRIAASFLLSTKKNACVGSFVGGGSKKKKKKACENNGKTAWMPYFVTSSGCCGAGSFVGERSGDAGVQIVSLILNIKLRVT